MTGEPATANQGQWTNADLFGVSLPRACRVTLGEGETPLQDAGPLGARLRLPGLALKREDLSPTGSHKARSLGLMVSQLLAQGIRQAVISSSGNAAVAASAYCRAAGIRLLCLISPRTPRVKVDALLRLGQLVVATPRPVDLLHHGVGAWGLADLRTSTNPLGPAAYRGIAAELHRAGAWASVFTFSNSGATALGLHQGARCLGGPEPQLHVVEGWPGGEITRPWYPPGESPPATGVGDLGTSRSRLAPAVRRAVRESGGRGWRVTRAELDEMRRLTRDLRPGTSWEGLAALVAASRWAMISGTSGPAVVLLTGAADQLDTTPYSRLPPLLPLVETTAALDQVLRHADFVPGAS